ncbi:cancer-related nucleoside-triphosphatase homolog [Halictus rubicundus]|uniref:cancer-related nucleoside-triphosphatase homolog n=1 Tax=Halictus rubicundus TaxID=77578 RepID=UPI004036A398
MKYLHIHNRLYPLERIVLLEHDQLIAIQRFHVAVVSQIFLSRSNVGVSLACILITESRLHQITNFFFVCSTAVLFSRLTSNCHSQSLVEVKKTTNMDTGATLRVSRVLLTGPPGIGKTTICKKIALNITEQARKVDGFYTQEVRNQSGNRIGFDVVLVNNSQKKSSLAKAEDVINQSQRTQHKVGKYYVFINDFESAALPVFKSNADILIIDEIGKMELFSKKFHDEVLELFSRTTNKPFIIATIPETHKVPQKYLSLFQKLQADKRSKLITVNHRNRDNLAEEILRLFS